MGYSEDQQAAAARERQSVRMGNADPNSLTTISGNMAWKSQQSSSSYSSSSWTSGPTYDTYPTYGAGADIGSGLPASTAPGHAVHHSPRPPKPHVDDWTDRAMKRIPPAVLVICAIVGALIGLAAGASSGAGAALLYAFFGAGAGLFALPAIIKLTQLALRVMAVAFVVGIFALILYAMAHSGK